MNEQAQEIRRCIEELQRLTPALFTAGRVLYVGANRRAVPALVPELRAAGVSLHLLEIHEPNVEHYRTEQPDTFEVMMLGDVRDIDSLALPALDAVVWWHGPEHLKASEWRPVLSKLEARAPLVVIGCPWGEWPQRAIDGNEHETHRTAIYPADLEGVGYKTLTVGQGPDRKGYLIAWRGETGREDETPMYYAKLASSYTYWLVRDGERKAMSSTAEVYAHGLAPVVVVSREELDEIPIKEE